jgi:hypothetical protein
VYVEKPGADYCLKHRLLAMLGLPRLAGRRAFFVAGQRHHT